MAAVCYQVHTHRDPAQVTRLVRRLVAGDDAIVIVSHDDRGEELPTRSLEALGNVHVMRTRGGYGDLSHVDRWMAAVRWLDAHGVDYDWMVTLSGQDYPVRSIATVEKELAESAYDAHLEHFPAFSPDGQWPRRRVRGRYLYRHHRLPADRASGPVRAAFSLARGVNLLQPWVWVNSSFLSVGLRTRTPLGPGFALWGGSFWTSMRRQCAEYVRDFYLTKPAVVRYFRGCLAAEEVFFQTVLVAADRFHLSADPLRYFDFRHGDGSRPKVLGVEDLPALRASTAHFARKFDPAHDTAVLDALDEGA